ncbi:MAG: hypothetical protein K0Q79_2192 [Flavipsychrobacter sp.]|jgi:hypothetical protein|nr:hypothetical protein [Flavipsychrobacter sp.]
MRLPVIWLLCTVCCACYAQEKPYDISPPLHIKEAGVNKVLCMENGSTFLFHFEPVKHILVKVFDPAHKEIASRRDRYRLLDVTMIEYVTFKGLYEINGEAVLFIDQDLNSRHSLLMLRYSAKGELLEERLVGESKSANRRIRYYVMKNKEDDNYQVLFCMDKRHPKENDMFIVFFNGKHEAIREMQLEIERKKYDYLEIVGAESQPAGVLITIALDKPVIYGRATDLYTNAFGVSDRDSAMVEGGPVYDHYLAYYYVPKDSAVIKRGFVELGQAVFPYYSFYTYNPFADALNLLLYSQKPFYYRFGLNVFTGITSRNLFFKINRDDMSDQYTPIANRIANDNWQQGDTTKRFEGMPVKMLTNENGLSTLISQRCMRYGEPETHARYDYQTYLRNICITQFDDNGREIWGTVLPLAQYYNSNKQYLNEKDFAMKWQNQDLFGVMQSEVYNRQFLSFNAWHYNKSYYIIYNDYNKHFNNSAVKKQDTVYSFHTTNACYYTIDRKKQVTKHYLFGEPLAKEYKSSMIEGADFDEQRGVYATLIRYTRYNKTSLRMAWRRMDQD